MQFTPEGIYKNLQLVQEARGKKVLIMITAPSALNLHILQEYRSH